MRVLLTNDDGIDSPGLHVLAATIAEEVDEVFVVAPKADWSGCGTAVGPTEVEGRVPFESVRLSGLEHLPAYAVDGPPGLAVLTACMGGYGRPPDAVVSGINRGPNTGQAVLHSGTVGAALTAGNLGWHAMAVSLDAGHKPHWKTAAVVAGIALRWVMDEGHRSVLNVNVPDLPLPRLKVRAAVLAPWGIVETTVPVPHAGELEMCIDDSGEEPAAGTDTALLRSGVVTVTSLLGLQAESVHSPTSPAALIERSIRASAGPDQ